MVGGAVTYPLTSIPGHPFLLSLARPLSGVRFRPSPRIPLPLALPFSLSLSFFNDSPQNRRGGALAVSISSEAPLSSTDHLTHK